MATILDSTGPELDLEVWLDQGIQIVWFGLSAQFFFSLHIGLIHSKKERIFIWSGKMATSSPNLYCAYSSQSQRKRHHSEHWLVLLISCNHPWTTEPSEWRQLQPRLSSTALVNKALTAQAWSHAPLWTWGCREGAGQPHLNHTESRRWVPKAKDVAKITYIHLTATCGLKLPQILDSPCHGKGN